MTEYCDKYYLFHVTVTYSQIEREIWTVEYCLVSSSHVVAVVHSQGVFVFYHAHRGRKRQLDPVREKRVRMNWKVAG